MSAASSWNARAATYDSAPRTADPDLLAWAASLAIDGESALEVVEVGCGTGLFSEALLATGRLKSLVACDVASAMLVAARRRLGQVRCSLVLLQVDEADLDLGPEADVVAARLVLRHMSTVKEPIARWSRWLRPRGRVVVVEGPPPVSDPGHPAAVLYREVMAAKHGRHAGWQSWEIADAMLDAGAVEVRTHERWTDGNSIRGWATAGGLDPARVEHVLALHRLASEAAEDAYRMTSTEDGDVLVRWRHAVVVGYWP